MSLNQGRSILAIPGPTVLPDRVLSAMHRQSGSICDGELFEMTDGLLSDLKKVAGTNGYVAIYQANGHGAWEATLRNTVKLGGRMLVLSNGFFSSRWGMVAESIGLEVEYLNYGMADHAEAQKLQKNYRPTKLASSKLSWQFRRKHRHLYAMTSARCEPLRGMTHCSWSIALRRSAATRSRWTRLAWM
ncbi:hypothetical protein [Tateyamaria sp. syn59]|uniref:hypothetical protein n=1 Tax=Tateyamaria sp. syn59 TaxID=2576942 RepID=UPI00351A04D1